jgi:hypothetical protein
MQVLQRQVSAALALRPPSYDSGPSTFLSTACDDANAILSHGLILLGNEDEEAQETAYLFRSALEAQKFTFSGALQKRVDMAASEG